MSRCGDISFNKPRYLVLSLCKPLSPKKDVDGTLGIISHSPISGSRPVNHLPAILPFLITMLSSISTLRIRFDRPSLQYPASLPLPILPHIQLTPSRSSSSPRSLGKSLHYQLPYTTRQNMPSMVLYVVLPSWKEKLEYGSLRWLQASSKLPSGPTIQKS
jgi:hypothetical protein